MGGRREEKLRKVTFEWERTIKRCLLLTAMLLLALETIYHISVHTPSQRLTYASCCDKLLLNARSVAPLCHFLCLSLHPLLSVCVRALQSASIPEALQPFHFPPRWSCSVLWCLSSSVTLGLRMTFSPSSYPFKNADATVTCRFSHNCIS